MRRAVQFDPHDPDVLAGDGYFLLETGWIKDSVKVLQEAQALEPLTPTYASSLVFALMADKQADAAIAVLEAAQLRQGAQYSVFAQAYAMAGHYDRAAEQILRIPNRNVFGPGQPIEKAAQLIRTAPAKIDDPSALPKLPRWLDWVYGYVGAPERLLDYPERAIQAGEPTIVPWSGPSYASVRKTERFKKLVREVGLVDYWRERGWPDLCHPTTGDDFECN